MTDEAVREDTRELLSTNTLRGLLTVRFGLRSSAPRNRKQCTLAFIPIEGFDVLKAKVMQQLSSDEKWRGAKITENGAIFFKQTNSARQVDNQALSSHNFWELLHSRWACVVESEKDKLALEASVQCRLTVEVFDFGFFVYLEPPKKQKPTMYRATAARMPRAVKEVAAMQEEQGVTLGPITAHHVAVHHARQPDDVPLSIPTDNITRQAQALDAEMARLDEQQGQDARDDDYAEIEVQLFGSWVKVPVRISSIRAALRLPNHDIFSSGIFHGYTPQLLEPSGEDVLDSDHLPPATQPTT